ncbi:hypothetical protein ACFOWX_02525 [Sphingorhabdus arenilitoris]|uniref:CopG family transcriptional regulator n=1 Tax=Sphingorhabdus arenilitoris TaxID=1490041 RepID=A0ABV8RD63_9SPHN
MAKNITLAVDEKLLDQYRLLAAQQNTTVNALVRKHMEETVGMEKRRQSAIAKMLELGRTTKAKFDMSGWDREASYAPGGKV